MAIQLSNENQRLLAERLSQLPDELRSILEDGTIRTVSEKAKTIHHLSETAVTSLENELVFVVMGFELLSELPDRLTEELGVEKETARSIAQDFEKALPPGTQEIVAAIEQADSETEENEEAENRAMDSETSPTSTAIPQTTSQAEPKTEPTKPINPLVPLTPPQTDAASESETPSIPRYARPLTDIPRYDEEQNPNTSTQTPNNTQN